MFPELPNSENLIASTSGPQTPPPPPHTDRQTQHTWCEGQKTCQSCSPCPLCPSCWCYCWGCGRQVWTDSGTSSSSGRRLCQDWISLHWNNKINMTMAQLNWNCRRGASGQHTKRQASKVEKSHSGRTLLTNWHRKCVTVDHLFTPKASNGNVHNHSCIQTKLNSAPKRLQRKQWTAQHRKHVQEVSF